MRDLISTLFGVIKDKYPILSVILIIPLSFGYFKYKVTKDNKASIKNYYESVSFNRNILSLLFSYSDTSSDIINLKKGWIKNREDLQLVSADNVCENNFNWLTTKMDNKTVKLFCRLYY